MVEFEMAMVWIAWGVVLLGLLLAIGITVALLSAECGTPRRACELPGAPGAPGAPEQPVRRRDQEPASESLRIGLDASQT